MKTKFNALILCGLALASADAGAAGLTAGSSINVKVVGSSTGAPCEYDCWEKWQDASGLGSIMVVKDATGHVVDAGHISDPYFYDLWISTDEAIRKIPSAQQITRYGTVRNVVGATFCSVNCLVTADFGYVQDVVLGINSNGKLAGASAIDDALLNTLDEPHEPPVGYPNACPYRLPGPNCHIYGGSQYPGGITHITIWAVYDSMGNLLGHIIRYDNGPDKWVPFVLPH